MPSATSEKTILALILVDAQPRRAYRNPISAVAHVARLQRRPSLHQVIVEIKIIQSSVHPKAQNVWAELENGRWTLSERRPCSTEAHTPLYIELF